MDLLVIHESPTRLLKKIGMMSVPYQKEISKARATYFLSVVVPLSKIFIACNLHLNCQLGGMCMLLSYDQMEHSYPSGVCCALDFVLMTGCTEYLSFLKIPIELWTINQKNSKFLPQYSPYSLICLIPIFFIFSLFFPSTSPKKMKS